MPNAGKSSLFNALTRAGAAGGQLPVHHDRAERGRGAACRTSGSTRWRRRSAPRPIVHETIAVPRHRRASCAGAHQGEGLGNKFLANIRETDAILHVVRAHDDAKVVHPEGASTRSRTSRRSRPSCSSPTSSRPSAGSSGWRSRRSRATRRRSRRSAGCARWSRRCRRGAPCATVPAPEDAPGARRSSAAADRQSRCCTWRTSPRASRSSRRRRWWRTRRSAAPRAAAVSARLEAELSELDDEEAAAMREELGVGESGLETVIREAFALLDLIRSSPRARTRRAAPGRSARGTRARARGRAIHTDIQRGFVRAEVIAVGRPGRRRRLRRRPRTRPAAGRGPRLRDAGRRRDDLPVHAVGAVVTLRARTAALKAARPGPRPRCRTFFITVMYFLRHRLAVVAEIVR